ncbi:DUF1993 family protein [Novosphingobium sp.]|uniref:DUF1993 domain-containing protein n=1 Tax=Novosphingobium sp. TaxID=1874826 RepID=UPI0035B4EFBC
MSYSLYRLSVPGFIAMLNNFKAWLDKAAAQKDEAVLIEARLAPDMFALARQIQIASDAAKGAAARLTGADAPAMADTEASFAELKQRCDKTIAYLESVDPAAYDAGASREIVITFPNGAGMRFDGVTFLTGFAVPNFYFHAAAAYAILRNQGVEIGKADFLMHLAPHMFGPPEQ